MKTEKIVRIALLVAVGLVIFLLEQSIPRPLPWVRFGMANIATLLALYLFGSREAVAVAAMRSVIGSMFAGGLLNPAFLFSFSGGVLSALVMAAVRSRFNRTFSIIGVSIWGALTHNVVQLLLALVVFVRRPELLSLLPFFLLAAVVTGFLTGTATAVLLPVLERRRTTHVPPPVEG